MASASQSMLNQSLFEEQDVMISSQLGVFPFQTNFASLPLGCSQPLKTLTANTPPFSLPGDSPLTNLSDQSIVTKQNDDLAPHFPGVPPILSLQRSASNYWAWAEVNDCISMRRSVGDDHLGVSAMKMKKIKARRKVREPRFCFKTMSDVDVLDDGYKWRKYGQKVVKNTQHPRSHSPQLPKCAKTLYQYRTCPREPTLPRKGLLC